ncbi:3-oxoacyl-[acyl-carrier-protein] synthase 3 [Piscirickettsia salmonis]|uniref:Beta-ketoacyl-[acyl-carrier-protein] synthase III n=1 Tax=Piscirickettsia salmonis TaxID=1238 RepID=A0A1L6TDX6_PISSA|nr:beta-ketoacyl-ACP synthase III [Piscirickettsia salmonis]AKP74576.1 3-oxoacyl-ACP synthase [Piscirickettsia salmonis LF-89 = ATCC VR-1361]ALB23579.1 3-oxoacyl-[acyl-carrier-] synthase III family protein [Piscirickettsia salmonis]ALY03447.1 3-oxoacyl-ACP synthase [Piscirickettsia salmonis]AMA43011.1 3-oxoacyl-ACP synthase [Piscirickettsia salmonis]AOS35481.1 3-oxoacyl-ACP synthase [Piscirickettsia salmonis]
MSYARILGTGSNLPTQVVTNQALAERIETSDEWIRERTGIYQRHIISGDESTASMATAAAERALSMANVAVNEVDLIIVATTTADRVFPSVACDVQQRLGLKGCAAFDVQAVCSGFIYALATADQFIRSGMATKALVIGSEAMSRILDWNDRATCVLFGDGAGAVVLGKDEQTGILSSHLHADGHQKELLWTPAEQFSEQPSYITMEGRKVFKEATAALGRLVTETLTANQLKAEDLDWLIPHQANLRIIQATAKKLAMSMDQVVVTVDQHANTSAASIPLALDIAVRDGRVQREQLVLLEAFGGGFTWGSVLVRF